MNKTILVGLAILAVSTSAASAGTHRTHHSRAMNPNASAAAMNPNPHARSMNAYAAVGAPPTAMPGASSKDRDMYMKNLHDSGYDPKNDLTKSGTMRQQ
jgi:hypothetical protein